MNSSRKINRKTVSIIYYKRQQNYCFTKKTYKKFFHKICKRKKKMITLNIFV